MKNNSVQIIKDKELTKTEKIQFIDSKFKISNVVEQLHTMMKEVTKEKIDANTVNAACNCVARLNETINVSIQAAKYLDEK